MRGPEMNTFLWQISTLLRGGMFPVAYVYPRGMRETRDLLRRRMHLVHIRAGTLAHIQNTNSQYNLPPFSKKICHARNRQDIAERFTDESLRKNIELDLNLIDHYDPLITQLELFLVEHAKIDDAFAFHLLRSVPGIGKVLALVLLYEIHTHRLVHSPLLASVRHLAYSVGPLRSGNDELQEPVAIYCITSRFPGGSFQRSIIGIGFI